MGICCVECGRRVLQQSTREVFGTLLLALGMYMILFTYHNIDNNIALAEVAHSFFMNKKKPSSSGQNAVPSRRTSNLRFTIRIPHRG